MRGGTGAEGGGGGGVVCNQSTHFVTLPSMTTTTLSARRIRGIHPKGGETQQSLRGKGSNLPEYLEQPEGQAVIASAPNLPAQLLMLEQRWAGRRVSEALALEKRDLILDSGRSTLRLLRGKGNKSRGLAGKPLAGLCITPSRRITVVYGVIVYAIRFKNPSLHR